MGFMILIQCSPSRQSVFQVGACRRDLPNIVTVHANLTGRIEPAMLGARYGDLRLRRVLIDAPPRYC